MGKEEGGTDSFDGAMPENAMILPSTVQGYLTEGMDSSNLETRIAEVRPAPNQDD